MKTRRTLLLALALAVAPLTASAQPATITVDGGWISAPPIPSVPGAGYMVVHNNGAAPDRLLSVSSPRIGRIEMHDMQMNGNMMTMRAMQYGVTIPANGAVAFNEHGAHLMLMNIERPLTAGEQVPVHLHFQHAGDVQANLQVRARR